MQRTHRAIERARLFVRDYTRGLSLADVRRLFDKDAAQAYSILTRDQQRDVEEPGGRLRRALYRARIVFLGLSYKLTPARRLLFAASLVFTLLGLLSPFDVGFTTGSADFQIVFSPLWFLAAIGSLLFLLTMELVDRIRVRDELEVARQLQADLLPRETPDVPGWRFAHSYRTANEVGGDQYDFLPLPDGRLALMMGDASGHGMAAGLLMAIANATLHTAVDLDPAPERVAALLNRTLHRTGDRRAFMTLFYGVLDPATGRLDFVCAGHPFPLLRHRDGSVEELGLGGLPLGLRADLEPAPASVTIAPGETLVTFTDGLPEAVSGPDGEAFGFGRLQRLLARPGPPRVVLERILAAFDDHVESEPLADDLTLVVMAREG